jgi:UV DNA damage endonuclease
MIRLGFAVRAVGRPELNGGGGAAPHLSRTLAALGDMLSYLARIGVGFYRVALAPGHAFAELADCAAQIELLAQRLAAARLRLGVHLPPGLALGSADGASAARAIDTIEATAALLALLDGRAPPAAVEHTMVVHLGAAAADGASLGRFAARYRALSAQARVRLAIEHEGAGPSLGLLLALHQRCGAPVVFDTLHWELHNPEALPLGLALGLALATWPPGARPEVHLSSQRSEAHLLPPRPGATARVLPPRPGQHADFVAAGDLERLLLAARGLPPFDLMLEAKAGDLALLRLRAEIARRAPALAAGLA